MRPISHAGRLFVFILVGLVVGGIVGETLLVAVRLLGGAFSLDPSENNLYYLLQQFSIDWGFGMPPHGEFELDLYMVRVRLGLGIRLNPGSLLGFALSLYLERWSR